jgi:hypothetical protein
MTVISFSPIRRRNFAGGFAWLWPGRLAVALPAGSIELRRGRGGLGAGGRYQYSMPGLGPAPEYVREVPAVGDEHPSLTG